MNTSSGNLQRRKAKSKKGGEFYTPRCLTKLIVEAIDVKGGRIFDPSCGSGGFFVSALEKFEREGTDTTSLAIYGQESKDFCMEDVQDEPCNKRD